MATRPAPLLSSPPVPIAAAALLGAGLVGAMMAAGLSLGIGLLMAFCYAPLVMLNLPVGLALWVALVFIEHHPAVSVGPNAAGILIGLAWVGTLGARRGTALPLLRRHRKLVGAILLLLVWLTLSLVWADRPGLAFGDVWVWYVAALVFLVIATTIEGPRHVRLIVAAFILGAVMSVAIGIAGGALQSSGTAIDSATATEGRLQGGGGDPNYLAAGLVPAIVLAAGLAAGTRNLIARWAIAVTMGLLGLGLAATQSRGGILAAVAVVIAAFVVFRRRRAQVLGLVAAAAAVAGLWFASTPGAWERVTSFDGGGNGRTELWEVGWRMYGDHPATGVGLNNFRHEAPRYVRKPGNLEFVELIAERPRVVHNAYLQLLVETGVIGVLLFAAIGLGCLQAALLAARRFDASGDDELATLARSAFVALVGMLAASFFLSNGPDKRLWALFALGPALLGLAHRSAETAE